MGEAVAVAATIVVFATIFGVFCDPDLNKRKK
jgi:hypothetical protein